MNEVVAAITKMAWQGNIVPHAWYKHPLLRYEDGKANLVAITLLSDIVYWYRAKITRDEFTNEIVEMRERFAADMLHRDYAQWAESYGLTARQVRDSVKFLLERNIIRVDIRTVRVGGANIANRVFLEPVVATLAAVSNIELPRKTGAASHEEDGGEENKQHGKSQRGNARTESRSRSKAPSLTFQRDLSHVSTLPVSRSNVRQVTLERDNTENTTETSKETTIESLSPTAPSQKNEKQKRGGEREQEKTSVRIEKRGAKQNAESAPQGEEDEEDEEDEESEYGDEAQYCEAVPPLRDDAEKVAKLLLIAFAGVRTPLSAHFNPAQWDKSKKILLDAAHAGITTEQMAKATKNAKSRYSELHMVTVKSVLENFEEFLTDPPGSDGREGVKSRREMSLEDRLERNASFLRAQ